MTAATQKTPITMDKSTGAIRLFKAERPEARVTTSSDDLRKAKEQHQRGDHHDQGQDAIKILGNGKYGEAQEGGETRFVIAPEPPDLLDQRGHGQHGEKDEEHREESAQELLAEIEVERHETARLRSLNSAGRADIRINSNPIIRPTSGPA